MILVQSGIVKNCFWHSVGRFLDLLEVCDGGMNG